MTDKITLYRELCDQEESIPLFSQAWWLDATAGEHGWDVVMVEKAGAIVASLPYVLKNKFGFKVITQPPLSQHLGPWIKQNSEFKYSKNLAYEKDVLQELYSKLPKHDRYQQGWHYARTNWLPLYWLGYSQTTRYTYIINDISKIDDVVNNFEHSKRKNIKKSEKIVKIVYDLSAKEFYENHCYTLKKQGQKISYTFEVFERLYKAGYSRGCAKTIAAFDDEGKLHGALFVVWDKMSAYDLISTIDPDYRTHGAASLLVKEIVRYTSSFVNKFDFEGSMIEPVERSFRQFGAYQTPYFYITKSNSIVTDAGVLLYQLMRR